MSFGYGFTMTSDGGRLRRMLRHLPRPLDGGVSALSIDGKDRYLVLAGNGLPKSPDAGAHWHLLRERHRRGTEIDGVACEACSRSRAATGGRGLSS